MGTVSDELADGVLRLLADLGIVASTARRPDREVDQGHATGSGSAAPTRSSGRSSSSPSATGVGVLASIARQAQADRPHRVPAVRRRTGVGAGDLHRRGERSAGRSTRSRFPGPTRSSPRWSGVHNCFPKDVSALKQLAGNSGYHFQLLTAVIEVNELQKRRVDRQARSIWARCGQARSRCSAWRSRPNTDDMREASSLVLAARLQADGRARQRV